MFQITDVAKGSSEHRCNKLCHHGDCSVCDGDSIIKCRCRATSKVLSGFFLIFLKTFLGNKMMKK